MQKPVESSEARAGNTAPIKLVPQLAPARTHVPTSWLIGGILGLAVIAAIGAAWWLMHAGGNVRYITSAVTHGAVTPTVSATGTVNPVLTIIIGSYVSGVIQELQCDYNTQVKKGQICAKIDPRPYQAIVDQNIANLAVAKAQLVKDKAAFEYAKVTFERDGRLVQTNAISRDAYDNAKNAYDQAQAQIIFDEATIEQRQAELASAQVNLDYTNIVSPVDGTVVSRNVTVGQTVAASFQTPTLFLIATDLTQMEVDTNVSESDIGGLKDGDKAYFTIDAFPKRTFEGTVTQLRQSPQSVQNVVTYDVVVGVDNTDLALKPGMTAATRIVIDERKDVLRVPSQALRYVPAEQHGKPAEQMQVWVLREGKPVAVPVTAGLDDDSFTEIVRGNIKPGDQVIVTEQRSAGNTALPTPRL